MTTLSQKLELLDKEFPDYHYQLKNGELSIETDLRVVKKKLAIFLSQTVKELLEEMVVEEREIRTGGASDKSLENAHTYGYNQSRQDQLERLKKILEK